MKFWSAPPTCISAGQLMRRPSGCSPRTSFSTASVRRSLPGATGARQVGRGPMAAGQLFAGQARHDAHFPTFTVSTGFLMTSNQQRQRALLCLDRLRALVEHANLPDMEVKRLATEINEV